MKTEPLFFVKNENLKKVNSQQKKDLLSNKKKKAQKNENGVFWSFCKKKVSFTKSDAQKKKINSIAKKV